MIFLHIHILNLFNWLSQIVFQCGCHSLLWYESQSAWSLRWPTLLLSLGVSLVFCHCVCWWVGYNCSSKSTCICFFKRRLCRVCDFFDIIPGTTQLAFFLRKIKFSPFMPNQIFRNSITDFAVVISILIWSLIGNSIKDVPIEKLNVPSVFAPTFQCCKFAA